MTFDKAQLATLKMPVLVLWGAHDSLIAPATAQWFGKSIPGSTVIVYPDSGHMPQREVAQRSADDLSGWLSAKFALYEVPAKPG